MSITLHVGSGIAQRSGTPLTAYKNAASATVTALRMNASHRHWCFTTFDLTVLETFPVLYEEHVFQYLACQVERCPDTQREHVQGYVEFTDRVGGRTVKTRLRDVTMHLEPRKGVLAQLHVISAWRLICP